MSISSVVLVQCYMLFIVDLLTEADFPIVFLVCLSMFFVSHSFKNCRFLRYPIVNWFNFVYCLKFTV